MLPVRHILVPLDFGAASQQALQRALGLARAFDAPLTILHVVDLPSYLYSVMPFSTDDSLTPFEHAARMQLDAAVATVRASYPRARGVLRRGIAFAEILSAVDDTGADFVVMGTHGRHGVAHALLGSVADRVVRFSPVPVLTVRSKDERDAGERSDIELQPGGAIRRIVVPSDFGEVSNHALDEAIELATSFARA